MRLIGLMSGTSFDAIDAVAADVRFGSQNTIESQVIGHVSVDLPDDLRGRLAAALPPAPTTAAEMCYLDVRVGQAFATAAGFAFDNLCQGTADLVVSSGQTVFHWVTGDRCRGTLQLGEPTWIAESLGLPVVSNLRTRDVACGGQGAPLVSLVDQLMFADRPGCGVLNIGGIANITVPKLGLAYDIGPGNALIDAVMAAATGGAERLDRDGRTAGRGRVVPEFLDALLSEPYYAAAPPKTTGKELFNHRYLDRFALPALPDLVATLTRLTATTIAHAVRHHRLTELIVSGGGVRNPILMAALGEQLPSVTIRHIDDFGLSSAAKEAFAFAILGFLTWHGIPAVDPRYTGARRAAILGSITPGAEPLRLPPPIAVAPTRLVLH